MRAIKAVASLIAVVVLLALLAIPQLLAMRFWPARAGVLPHLYHRALIRILGIKLDIEGSLAPGPVLITANHVSWLDIMVLSALGEVSFIAKQEVASWPGFGTMARLQRTVFVNREQRRQTVHAKTAIESRLDAGDRIVLFAEGTSSDGNRILPFRTSLFAVASYRPDGEHVVRVQPLSLVYARVHGLPIDRSMRPKFAWYGDMSMVPHIWAILCAGPIDVKIVLHEPVTLDEFADRKQLAAHCEARVRAGFLSTLLGRPVRPEQAGRSARQAAAAE
mgnify:CR=1 FL=1